MGVSYIPVGEKRIIKTITFIFRFAGQVKVSKTNLTLC